MRPGLVAVAMAMVGLLVGCQPGSQQAVSSYIEWHAVLASIVQPAPPSVLPDMDKPVGPEDAANGPVGDWTPLRVARRDAVQATSVAPASAPAGRAAETQPAATRVPQKVRTADGREYVRWQDRRGPAYPGDFWHSFGRDAQEIPLTMWDDTKAAARNPWTYVGLGAAAATGISLAATDADDNVADHVRRHGPHLNSSWDSVGDAGGNPGTHFAITGAWYFASLASNDVKGYETSKAALNALAINGIVTMGLKGAARTHSPNGDPLGWPSGHTSSSFCFATVLAEAYGPWAGVPAFAFAAFVGYERIDARNHDFSDVISGAILGTMIGHVVFQNHIPRINGWEVTPFLSSDGAGGGVALMRSW